MKKKYTVTGYDRSKGGVQFGGLQSYRASMAQAVLRSRNKIEVKGVDILLTQSPVINTTNDGTGSVVLNLIPPGSGSWNRIGRKAQLRSVRLRGNCQFVSIPGSAGVVVGNWVRMIVVWDKQPSGSQPSFDAIFGYTPQSGTEATTLLAPLRYDNMERFTVLKDSMIVPVDTLAAGIVTSGSITQVVPFDCYIPLKDRECVYSGQTATQTIADISSGGLYVYFRALNNQAINLTTPGAQASITADSLARLRFLDG